MTQATQAPVRDRARIAERTLRKDPWWRQPAINATALAVVVIYLTWASLVNGDYFWKPYISPLYSPCLATTCKPGAGFDWIPWLTWLSPAIIIIGGPTGFRLTCYYYRKAYYRAFWRAPAASVTFGENKCTEPPKLAMPRSPATPGPRSTTAAPMVEPGKNAMGWWVRSLASPKAMPS